MGYSSPLLPAKDAAFAFCLQARKINPRMLLISKKSRPEPRCSAIAAVHFFTLRGRRGSFAVQRRTVPIEMIAETTVRFFVLRPSK